MSTAPEAPQMGQFLKYPHLERLGHREVADIDYGTIHVYPKLDGTNASVWAARNDDGEYEVRCGSRNRVLSIESDNAGFCAWVHGDSDAATALRLLVLSQPNVVVYGEWLVPHTLKTYRDDAWRRFWIFDVYAHGVNGGESGFMPFEDYGEAFEQMGLDVIHPLCTMENPSRAQLDNALAANTFLVQDGAGAGEGVVIKNYGWRNAHGRQTWAKLVRNEFKADNAKVFGIPHVEGAKQVEAEIVQGMLSPAFIQKEWAKVVQLVANDAGEDLSPVLGDAHKDERYATFVLDNRRKIIPRFLGTFWLTFVDEHARDFVKKHKNPVVDFGKLQKLATIRAKQVLKDWF